MNNLDISTLTGKIITKNHIDYSQSVLSWNRAIEKFPEIIIYCFNNTDIITAINFARENNLIFRIRSGCHHYEGFSTGNDILVIDVSNINFINLDQEKEEVTIGGGVRNRELYEVACSNGYAFPGGGCPTVGVAGFTLGGGWGYSARFLGLGIDSLLEVSLINFEGKLIKASKDINPDLFWALKGAGAGNFGVITSLKFKLSKKIPSATSVSIDYLNISLEDKIKVFLCWQENFKNCDKRFNCKVSLYNSLEKGNGIHITGIFYGSKEEAKSLLKPFLEVLNNVESEFIYTSPLEINRAIQDAHPDYESYKSVGRFINRDYSIDEIKKLLLTLEERPEGSVYAALSLYGMGGEIASKSKDNDSFFYRDAHAILGLQSVWEDKIFAQNNKDWVVRNFLAKTKPITEGSFIAFPIKELDDYENEYFGENIHLLKKIKNKYDPINLFNFEQSIRP